MTNQGHIPRASTSWADRSARSYDFGRMTWRMPDAVVTPETADEAARVVRHAAGHEVSLTIRGGGHSQGGQCLTDAGVVLDTARLDRIEVLGPELVRAQGGAQWGKVVEALSGKRRLPAVLTDIGTVTVGGTLSAGGMGTTSHRYGAQVAQVEQLEVVTGAGERVLCSATRNTDLFDAARAGQGQFGIITDAWIRLRAAGERLRMYELLYRDFERFADDLERVVDDDRFDHLRARILSAERDVILYAGIEHDGGLEDEKALEGLGHDKLVHTRNTNKVGQGLMFPAWFASWKNYHPWRDWFMPWETLRTLIAQPWLDPSWLPRWTHWTGIYPVNAEVIDAPLFMRPTGKRMVSYSILTMHGHFRYEQATVLNGRLKEIDRTLVGLGGKSYLSGGVDYGPGEWAEHYGEMFDKAVRWKREFDPKRVFRRHDLPFGGESPA